MITQKEQILLHISLISGVGPVAVQKIVQNVQDLILLYSMRVHDFVTVCRISQRLAQLVVDGLQDKKPLDDELSLIVKHRVKITTIISDDYPELLKHINVPPVVLYYHGIALNKFSLCCAVVGSRKSNNYGKKVVQQLLPSLVAHDVTIVSGGAIGIDTLAHQETLASYGKTIAVLGSGLLCPHPLRNRQLFNRIVQNGGAIVSPFALTMAAHPGNFPARNRIIAGLSKGCIVVQAAQKSGARITADFALNQGRTVFAVPGMIDDPVSIGCHELIRQGATLISSAHDVLVDFGLVVDGEQANQELPFQTTKSKPQSVPSTLHTSYEGGGKAVTRQSAPAIQSLGEVLTAEEKKPKTVQEKIFHASPGKQLVKNMVLIELYSRQAFYFVILVFSDG